MLFNAHELRELDARFAIHTQSDLFCALSVELLTVHQDNAHAGKCIVIEYADGLAYHVSPAHPLLRQRHATLIAQ